MSVCVGGGASEVRPVSTSVLVLLGQGCLRGRKEVMGKAHLSGLRSRCTMP